MTSSVPPPPAPRPVAAAVPKPRASRATNPAAPTPAGTAPPQPESDLGKILRRLAAAADQGLPTPVRTTIGPDTVTVALAPADDGAVHTWAGRLSLPLPATRHDEHLQQTIVEAAGDVDGWHVIVHRVITAPNAGVAP